MSLQWRHFRVFVRGKEGGCRMRILSANLVVLFFLTGCTTVDGHKSLNSGSHDAIEEDARSPERDAEVTFEEPSFPIQAGSWGGKVRAGPGMEFAQVASLKEGDSVVLLSVTDVEMNGYLWFRIQYGGGREGFQWGGILCAKDVWVEGLFQRCATHRHLNSVAQVRPNADVTAIEQIHTAYELLPGYWVSSSDSKSILVFDDRRGTFDIYDGVQVAAGSWALEEFETSPTKVTLRRTVDGNVDVYSILFLDAKELTLSFLPRGNTLSFYRME